MIENKRYLRHSIIDWFDQSYIQNLHILVVGAGALGNETVKNLSLLGCGDIDIYDFDTIEEHNLTRSVLFNEKDIGKNKAEVVAEKARILDPNISVQWFDKDITMYLSPAKIQKYDIVFCCVDNFESRIYLNKLCFLMKIDLINMGIDSRYQSTEIFPFSTQEECACYECNLPFSVYNRLKQRYSCGGLKKLSFIEKKIPTTIITSSMASFGVSIGLRLGENVEHSKSFKLLIDTINTSSYKTFYDKNTQCPVCSTNTKNIKLLTFNELGNMDLALNDCTSLTLSHQIIKKMQCQYCGEINDFKKYYFNRASMFDDSLTYCPKCNNQSVNIEMTDMIEVNDLKYIVDKNDFRNILYISYKTADTIYLISKGEISYE